jgi:hypothetical protein
MFRLAGHLNMTVRELGERMDSREFSEWIAYTRYFEALPDSWRETGLLASALLAPHIPRDKKRPEASDFVPLEKPPQHPDQDLAALKQLRREMGLTDDG